MAPKAQKRTLRTTRPRRNAARIAQERTGRSGGKRPSAGRSGKSADKKAGKEPGRATRVRRREARTEVRRGRFLLLVGFMSVLGFTTVYLGEAALNTFQGLEVDGKATSLWDKIVDRLLDRDIPLVNQPAPKKPTPEKAKKAAAKTLVTKPALPEKKPAVVKIAKLPKASIPTTPRAELPAPSAVAYAKETSAGAPTTAEREKTAAASRAARMEALLQKVGVDP